MVDLKENISNVKKNPAGKLLSIESIFKWKPVIYEENLKEINCEFEPESKNQFNFYNFIIRLVNYYKSCNENTSNDDSALKAFDELILAADEFNEDGDGGFFRKIENAYYHMVYASKTFLLLRNERHEEANEIIEKIKEFDEMNDCNKAAIHAMKSAVFALYSNEDIQKAFASIDKALKLDEHGLYYFLKGLYIRRIRRMTNPFESPSPAEKEHFEKALEKEPSNMVFKLYVADVYREVTKHASQRSDLCSHFLPQDNSLIDGIKSKIDQQIKLAAQYYKDAVEAYPKCPYVMFRAAEGLAKLPKDLNDIKLARTLTKEGLNLSPENVSGNLVQAFLYEKFDKNIKEALKHLKICAEKSIFDADMNMIRILHTSKPNQLDGMEVLKELMKKYKEKARHAILYSQMVSYYMFVKYDLVKANENAINFYELNTGSTCMQVHRSCFIATADPFPLIDVLIDEVKYTINGHKLPEPLENSCKKFIQFINFQNISIMKGFPQNFRQQILQGKPMRMNDKCMQKPFKNFDPNTRKNVNKRDDSGKDRRPHSTNNRPSASNLPNSGNNRNTPAPPKKTPIETDHPPSLLDIHVSKPVVNVEKPTPVADVVEKSVEKPAEEENDLSSDSTMQEVVMKIIKEIKKKKKPQSEGKLKSKLENEQSIAELLKLMGISNEKNTREKKHRSDSYSESDSDYQRRKDRRRERSRRRHRSRSDSDDPERYSRRHRRHKHHSSDSENSSRSVRRKSHKKDRYERDYSPYDKHRRRQNRSSDDDFDYKSTYHRDDSVSSNRRRQKNSVSSRATRDRSLSYDKRRRASPKKYKSSRRRETSPDEPRRERENSQSSRDSRDRSASYDRQIRGRSPKKDKSRHRERKISSEREDIQKTYQEKKTRRRSHSRDKPQSRGNKYKSKKEEGSSKNVSKRDQNSSRRSCEESDLE